MNSIREYVDSDDSARLGLLRSTLGTPGVSHFQVPTSRGYFPHHLPLEVVGDDRFELGHAVEHTVHPLP
jgi:hypothetical protein